MTNNLDWLQWKWFTGSQIKNFEWENPFWLYLLLVIPLVVLIKWVVNWRQRQKVPIALLQKDLQSSVLSVLRFIPLILLVFALALILIALARPQSTNEQIDQWSEGIDIMLVIDISESMQIEDFKPNRLNAAKEVAVDFIKGRLHDRIGLVVFSGDAYSRAPLTTDYDLLTTYIKDINFDLIQSRGTAIGSALAVGTNRLAESKGKSKVIILLSDGDNTAGNIDPITAAKLAYAHNIKIYTIAIGKEGRVPFGQDFFGRPRYVENTLDETTLRAIAKIGTGNFYRVSNNTALQKVFEEINRLEKVEIKETRYKNTQDYYPIYLTWGILFFLLWLLSKSTFVSNALVD